MATTLSRIMKKAASYSVIPLSNRTPHRNYTSAVLSTPLKTRTTKSITSNSTIDLIGKVLPQASIPTHHQFSALANRRSDSRDTLATVVRAIDRAIESGSRCAKEPREFPFKIENNAGEDFITLTREYQGEKIKVKVEYEEQEEGEEYVFCTVSISTKRGPTLLFGVMAEEDGIIIVGMAIQNPDGSFISHKEPNFREDLDLDLQKAFKAYLEVRGLEPSNTKFLNDYMVKKKQKRFIPWLDKLKNVMAPTDFA